MSQRQGHKPMAYPDASPDSEEWCPHWLDPVLFHMDKQRQASPGRKEPDRKKTAAQSMRTLRDILSKSKTFRKIPMPISIRIGSPCTHWAKPPTLRMPSLLYIAHHLAETLKSRADQPDWFGQLGSIVKEYGGSTALAHDVLKCFIPAFRALEARLVDKQAFVSTGKRGTRLNTNMFQT